MDAIHSSGKMPFPPFQKSNAPLTYKISKDFLMQQFIIIAQFFLGGTMAISQTTMADYEMQINIVRKQGNSAGKSTPSYFSECRATPHRQVRLSVLKMPESSRPG